MAASAAGVATAALIAGAELGAGSEPAGEGGVPGPGSPVVPEEADGVHADGPPPAHTGGFGEPTCHACHWENALDDGVGTLRLSGVPSRYEGGGRYRIGVTVARPGLRLGGFQLSARFAAGADSGAQAGALLAVDGRTRITEVEAEGGPLQYAHHTKAGTGPALAGDSARWTLEWTAPEGGGPVVFHAAANAANGDASELGDAIYRANRTACPPRRAGDGERAAAEAARRADTRHTTEGAWEARRSSGR